MPRSNDETSIRTTGPDKAAESVGTDGSAKDEELTHEEWEHAYEEVCQANYALRLERNKALDAVRALARIVAAYDAPEVGYGSPRWLREMNTAVAIGRAAVAAARDSTPCAGAPMTPPNAPTAKGETQMTPYRWNAKTETWEFFEPAFGGWTTLRIGTHNSTPPMSFTEGIDHIITHPLAYGHEWETGWLRDRIRATPIGYVPNA